MSKEVMVVDVEKRDSLIKNSVMSIRGFMKNMVSDTQNVCIDIYNTFKDLDKDKDGKKVYTESLMEAFDFSRQSIALMRKSGMVLTLTSDKTRYEEVGYTKVFEIAKIVEQGTEDDFFSTVSDDFMRVNSQSTIRNAVNSFLGLEEDEEDCGETEEGNGEGNSEGGQPENHKAVKEEITEFFKTLCEIYDISKEDAGTLKFYLNI